MKSPLLADLVDEAEISQLFAEYGPGQRWRVSLEVSALTFDDWWEKIVSKPNRRGEVVLAIRRPDGQVLLHTKQFYPEGVFRLPSGGVHLDESVLTGMAREAKEETGLEVSVHRFPGTVEYELRHGQRRLPFISYVFIIYADESTPVAQDSEERITGFRYVSPLEIWRVAEQLRALPGRWSDWGHFRAPPHDLVADALRRA
jgi:ADP-ribose pyrophosphatase YjhB (NUDIX family)